MQVTNAAECGIEQEPSGESGLLLLCPPSHKDYLGCENHALICGLRNRWSTSVHVTNAVADLSFTAHSGALRGLHAALGVPHREMGVGEMKVIVLRVKEVA